MHRALVKAANYVGCHTARLDEARSLVARDSSAPAGRRFRAEPRPWPMSHLIGTGSSFHFPIYILPHVVICGHATRHGAQTRMPIGRSEASQLRYGGTRAHKFCTFCLSYKPALNEENQCVTVPCFSATVAATAGVETVWHGDPARRSGTLEANKIRWYCWTSPVSFGMKHNAAIHLR